jgi:cephalosporin-C deacetylase
MIGQRSLFVLTAVCLLAPLGVSGVEHAARNVGSETPPQVVPYHLSGIYSMGDTVGWTISEPGGSASPNANFTYKILRDNAVLIKSGNLDLSSGRAKIEVKVDQPCMIYAVLSSDNGSPIALGAAVSPRLIKPDEPRPKDFDAFWKRKIADLEAVPEDPILTPGASGDADVDYATIEMGMVHGSHVYGQIAEPKKPGKHPAVLVLQWASPPYRLWSPWVVDLARHGWLALNIEPHDVLPTENQSYYNGLPQALKNYGSIGQDDREKSYFVDMYLRDYRAVDYLSKRSDWDGKTLLVMGTSMGGQQSFAVAGLHPKVTDLIVDVPAGCDLNAGLFGRQEGYPFFPVNDPAAMNAARYVDCVNFAPHIKATSLVAMGFVDTVSPPAGVWTVFNLIKGRKEAAPMVDSPHNNTATPEEQLPYTQSAAAWLARLVLGEKPDLK